MNEPDIQSAPCEQVKLTKKDEFTAKYAECKDNYLLNNVFSCECTGLAAELLSNYIPDTLLEDIMLEIVLMDFNRQTHLFLIIALM